jgi:diguanylate cyclase (GGDEF)-like protein
MRDPRVVEIEFLSDREEDPHKRVSADEYATKLGVSKKFFVDMVFSLFRDGCLEGAAQVTVPEHTFESLDQLGWHPRFQAVKQLLSPSASCPAYISHNGRVRMWNLRDQLQKTRIKDKFGILWEGRHLGPDVTVRLATLGKDAPSSLLFADVDGFKPVNDTLGHDVGDDVLKMIFDTVDNLTKTIGGEAYRWGNGDEVVVFLPGVGEGASQTIATAIEENVAEECAAHPALKTKGLVVTISVGLYSFTGRESADAIVKKADKLMYEAKKVKKAGR